MPSEGGMVEKVDMKSIALTILENCHILTHIEICVVIITGFTLRQNAFMLHKFPLQILNLEQNPYLLN